MPQFTGFFKGITDLTLPDALASEVWSKCEHSGFRSDGTFVQAENFFGWHRIYLYYCYRCHSTVAFHVFDKEAVFRRRLSMARRIELGLLRPGGMPQDRMLEPSASSEMARQLRAMK